MSIYHITNPRRASSIPPGTTEIVVDMHSGEDSITFNDVDFTGVKCLRLLSQICSLIFDGCRNLPPYIDARFTHPSIHIRSVFDGSPISSWWACEVKFMYLTDTGNFHFNAGDIQSVSFYDCDNLERIAITSNHETFHVNVDRCRNLKSVEMIGTPKEGSMWVANCNALESIKGFANTHSLHVSNCENHVVLDYAQIQHLVVARVSKVTVPSFGTRQNEFLRTEIATADKEIVLGGDCDYAQFIKTRGLRKVSGTSHRYLHLRIERCQDIEEVEISAAQQVVVKLCENFKTLSVNSNLYCLRFESLPNVDTFNFAHTITEEVKILDCPLFTSMPQTARRTFVRLKNVGFGIPLGKHMVFKLRDTLYAPDEDGNLTSTEHKTEFLYAGRLRRKVQLLLEQHNKKEAVNA